MSTCRSKVSRPSRPARFRWLRWLILARQFPVADNRWSTKKLVSSSELVDRIRDLHPSLAKLRDPHSDTTRSWQIPGYKGKFGFISSMSDHFCGECSRLRVGADGRVKVSQMRWLMQTRADVRSCLRCASLALPCSLFALSSVLHLQHPSASVMRASCRRLALLFGARSSLTTGWEVRRVLRGTGRWVRWSGSVAERVKLGERGLMWVVSSTGTFGLGLGPPRSFEELCADTVCSYSARRVVFDLSKSTGHLSLPLRSIQSDTTAPPPDLG